MRVLVTGSQGYIGCVLVPLLLEAGHEVTGLDADLYRRCTYGAAPRDIPLIERDIRDVTAEDLRGFDAVLHLAALSNDPLGDLKPRLTYEINYRASLRLGELARAAGVSRFLFSSSCSNYGSSGRPGEPLREGEALNPITPYAVSKVLVERGLSEMATEDFSPSYLRNATAYGMSPRIRFDLVLNNLVAWAVTTGKVHLKSDATAWRPLVHVEDIARAFLAVLAAPREEVHDQAFNIGATSENYTVRQLAEAALAAVPGSELEFARGASADARNYAVDCGKAERVLGFRARWTVAAGARELVESYRRWGLTLEGFEGDRYQRLAHIKALLASGALDPDLRRVRTATPSAVAPQLGAAS
ncbi:MAG: NAD-dependent epimerase/dehydratase family protein [Planctomycetota bacterium]